VRLLLDLCFVAMLVQCAPLCASSTSSAAGDSLRAGVTVDRSRHEVSVTAGPFNVPAAGGMLKYMTMSDDTLVQSFAWPVDGWYRGFRLEVLDGDGNPVARHVLHHLTVVNFDRRQLLYPIADRLAAVGRETADVSMPRSVGMPMTVGQRIGLYAMWGNMTGDEVQDVYLRVTLLWTPASEAPRPLDAMVMNMDVGLAGGVANTFDIPPGWSRKSFDFRQPVDGRLLAVGGHLHDYGVLLQLEDVQRHKTLVTITSTRDARGRVSSVSRKLLGVFGDGLRLRANRQYRVVAIYDNTSTDTVRNVMAQMAGLFAPDDVRQWPAVDPTDPAYQADLRSHGRMDVHQGMPHMAQMPGPSATNEPQAHP
jgi:hypothetical protein